MVSAKASFTQGQPDTIVVQSNVSITSDSSESKTSRFDRRSDIFLKSGPSNGKKNEKWFGGVTFVNILKEKCYSYYSHRIFIDMT